MRISDWSSDVCSSDLLAHANALEVEVVADHRARRRHHVGELHLADAQSAAAAGRAEPAEKEADELPEGVETEAARHYRISLEMAAEEPEVRLDVHLGDDMAFAMLATVFGNLGDAIEHQHRRQRELRITRTEKLAVRASQQLLVTEAVDRKSTRLNSSH